MDTSPPPDEPGPDDLGDARVRDLLTGLGAHPARTSETGGALPDGIPADVDDRITASLRAESAARERAGRDLLATLPAPGPMPDDVADRITAALGAERRRRAAAPVESPEGGSVSLLRRKQRVGRRRWPTVLAAAAAVAAVGVFGAVAIRTVTEDPSTSGASARIHVLVSGDTYRQDRLGLQARNLLAAPGATLRGSSTASGLLTTTVGIRSCLSGLGITDPTAVSVDLATYEGAPAAILVVTGAGTTTAYAVGRDCSAAQPHVLAGGVTVP